jgi:DIM1 family U5 snRNP protein
MSYMLPHLNNGWQVRIFPIFVTHIRNLNGKIQFFVIMKVDQAILAEEDRVVLVRFGHDWDPSCMRMDEVKR